MSIPDWLKAIKDNFTDAASFAMASRQVELLETQIGTLEERLRLKDDQIGLLVGKVADLEAQLVSLRADLALKTDEAAELEKQVDAFKEQEQYDVSSGIAFKRSKQEGGYEETPLCPTCHRPLSQLIRKWGCAPCSYVTAASPRAALSALREHRQKD